MRALVVMPVGEQRGGSELQLQQLVEHRQDAGLELTIAFLRDGPLVEWARYAGVPAVVIDSQRLRQPRMYGRTVRNLGRLARERRAEVVIGWMAKGQIYGAAAALAARLPAVWLQCGIPTGGALMDRAATLLPARRVITVSRGVDRAQRRLRPRRATAVVYPAVDIDRFDAARIGGQRSVRRVLGLPEDVPIFGSVGRLDRWKGFHVMLDAFPRVAERHPGVTCVLVGGPHEHDPRYADELEAHAARLGVNGNVRLVGRQVNPEEWMQAMDVFVHASDNEPFGMVVIEAMALGKAVVAGAAGGPSEVVTPGVDGLLAPYGDDRVLAAQIVRFLDDGDFRDRAGVAARRRALDFEVRTFARTFGAVVTAAVQRTNASVVP